MTLDELNAAVSDVLAGGKIGTPVSMRVHVQCAGTESRPVEALAGFMPTARRVFNAKPQRMMVRKHASAEQLNVLFEYEGGQTCFVTCGSGCASASRMQLLLFGSAGLVRLEGGEHFDTGRRPEKCEVDTWQARIQTALSSRRPILLE